MNMLNKKVMLFAFCLVNFYVAMCGKNEKAILYFCTAADQKYYTQLLNLIGSIHKVHFDDLGEISVYNLGLSEQQRHELGHIKKVKLYEVEKTNPDIIKPFLTASCGRFVPGWFAWKPVIIKQSLDRFPYTLYLDAGHVVLRPLYDLFDYIKSHGYFVYDTGLLIGEWITKFIVDTFDLNSEARKWILKDGRFLDASMLGFSRESSVYNDMVLPAYNYSRDLRYFEDDGSSHKGFGGGRHDQTIFGVLALLLRLDMFQQKNPLILNVNGEQKELFLTYRWDEFSDHTHIFHCRGAKVGDFTKYIIWNDKFASIK